MNRLTKVLSVGVLAAVFGGATIIGLCGAANELKPPEAAPASAYCLEAKAVPVASKPPLQAQVTELVNEEDAAMLARLVWGEARGCSDPEQAAVVWCVLNRVDNDQFPDTIQEVVTQPHQFDGYRPDHPIDAKILDLVQDVLFQWKVGKESERVLPPEYLFFEGDGKHNHFTTEWHGGTEWIVQ